MWVPNCPPDGAGCSEITNHGQALSKRSPLSHVALECRWVIEGEPNKKPQTKTLCPQHRVKTDVPECAGAHVPH